MRKICKMHSKRIGERKRATRNAKLAWEKWVGRHIVASRIALGIDIAGHFK